MARDAARHGIRRKLAMTDPSATMLIKHSERRPLPMRLTTVLLAALLLLAVAL
jgi:hypothetical protein